MVFFIQYNMKKTIFFDLIDKKKEKTRDITREKTKETVEHQSGGGSKKPVFVAGGKRFLLGIFLWVLVIGQIDFTETWKKTEMNPPDISEMNTQKKDTSEENKEEARQSDLPGSTDFSMIRVVLMDTGYQSYYHHSVTVEIEGKQEVFDPDSEVFSQGSVTLSSPDGFGLLSVERTCGHPHYKGKLTIYREPEGLLLVNTIPLEEYLKAVLPSEMPADYETEALKAQAVCARTYASKQMLEKRMEPYHADVDDSVSCQVYGNIEPEKTTDLAVEDTEGMVLEQDDQLIEAYYFSTSAGQTSTNEIWGNDEKLPYLQSVSCEFDADYPWRSWKTELSKEKLKKNLQELVNPEEIRWKANENWPVLPGWEKLRAENLEITKMSQSRAVTELTVTLSCELPSHEENTAGEAEEEKTKVYGTAAVHGEYEVRRLLAPGGNEIFLSDGTAVSGGNLLPSAYLKLDDSDGEILKISGNGYGHGVGMSQNGANEMAKQGYTCDQILNYFFRDVSICRLTVVLPFQE